MSERDQTDSDFILVESDQRSSARQPISIELDESQAIDLKPRSAAIKYIVGTIAALGLLLAIYIYRSSSTDSFPFIPVGSYLGKIAFAVGNDSDEISFYLERETDAVDAIALVLQQGWEPVRHRLDAALPLTLSGPESMLTLTGSARDGGFVGTVIESPLKREGTWRLIPLSRSPELQDDGSVYERAHLLLSLRAERRDVESLYAEREALANRQKEEVERITKFLTEGDTLKARASERQDEAARQLETERARFAELQQQTQELAKQLEISQKVISGGKLVGLARESLEREGRWLDSMLRSSGDIASTDFDSEMARAEQVLILKQKIAELRSKIAEGAVAGGVDAFRDNY